MEKNALKRAEEALRGEETVVESEDSKVVTNVIKKVKERTSIFGVFTRRSKKTTGEIAEAKKKLCHYV